LKLACSASYTQPRDDFVLQPRVPGGSQHLAIGR
jgi:hypothetical protein